MSLELVFVVGVLLPACPVIVVLPVDCLAILGPNSTLVVYWTSLMLSYGVLAVSVPARIALGGIVVHRLSIPIRIRVASQLPTLTGGIAWTSLLLVEVRQRFLIVLYAATASR